MWNSKTNDKLTNLQNYNIFVVTQQNISCDNICNAANICCKNTTKLQYKCYCIITTNLSINQSIAKFAIYLQQSRICNTQSAKVYNSSCFIAIPCLQQNIDVLQQFFFLAISLFSCSDQYYCPASHGSIYCFKNYLNIIIISHQINCSKNII